MFWKKVPPAYHSSKVAPAFYILRVVLAYTIEKLCAHHHEYFKWDGSNTVPQYITGAYVFHNVLMQGPTGQIYFGEKTSVKQFWEFARTFIREAPASYSKLKISPAFWIENCVHITVLELSIKKYLYATLCLSCDSVNRMMLQTLQFPMLTYDCNEFSL